MKRTEQVYKCIGCNKPTQTLHECWYGKGIRDISIKYHLQAPACSICHAMFHAAKRCYQKIICLQMGFDYAKINLAVNMGNYKYLESIVDENKDKINKLVNEVV